MELVAQDQVVHRLSSVRYSNGQIARLLDALDDRDKATPRSTPDPRYPYRIQAMNVDMRQPGGSTSVRYAVPTRWISRRGLGFLHQCFIHPGTSCCAQLITLYGTWTDTPGWVRACHYVEANIHEVEMSFMQPVELALYCPQARPCWVLLVEGDPLTGKMIGAWLRQLNASVKQVEDANALIQAGQEKSYDLLLLDMDMPGLDCAEVCRKLRLDGFLGRIVLMSARAGTSQLPPHLAACCDEFLPKPFGHDGLGQLLRTLHEEPILSTFNDDPALAGLIDDFVVKLREEAGELRAALEQGDLLAIDRVNRQLKAQGGMYGFESLAKTALAIEVAIANGATVAEVQPKVDEFLRLCSRIRSPSQMRGT